MRGVVDTNVFVSATIESATPPVLVVDHWLTGMYELVSSPPLLDELRGVLRRSTVRRYVHWTQAEIDNLLTQIQSRSVWVHPEQRLTVVARDPDDNRVREAAVAGHADVIVTGDRDLLDLGAYAGIRILTPKDFLALLETLA